MKSTKNIIVIVFILLCIGGEVFFSLTGVKADKDKINQNYADIESLNAQIRDMEEKYHNHKKSKAELKKLTQEAETLKTMIPTQESYMEKFSHLLLYFKGANCLDIDIQSSDKKVITGDTKNITKCTYKMEFLSPYSISKKIVENLNSTYQASNIDSYSFVVEQVVEPLKLALYKNLYKSKYQEIGKTSLQFTTFYNDERVIHEEVYTPFNLPGTSGDPFKYKEFFNKLDKNQQGKEGTMQDEEQMVSESVENLEAELENKTTTSSKLPKNSSNFTITVSDTLTSGDTYKISAPGEEAGSYIGIISDKNAEFDISVYNDHYELKVKDAAGQVQTSRVNIPCKAPNLSIVSTMRQVVEVMPNVHIRLHNYTHEKMLVSAKGSMLNHIHVFDHNGKEITKGKATSKVEFI